MVANNPKYKALKILGGSKPKNRCSIAGNIELHEGQRTLVFKKPKPVTKQSEGGLPKFHLLGSEHHNLGMFP